jgi:hypothetical protein
MLWPTLAPAQPRPVDFWITQSDPGLTAELARDDTLYIRLGYRSDRPLRFRVDGYAGGQKITAGAMYNIAPPYPAGEGEALVWIAYRKPVRLDAVRVTALDANWQPLMTSDTQVSVGWGPTGGQHRRADWATRLSNAQQDEVRRQIEQQGSGGSALVFFLLVAGVIGYFVLQPVTAIRFDGGWRIAALAPLAATAPLLVHAASALVAGSNLWPILLIFCLPVATLYLLALTGAHSLMRTPTAT